jgi:uncharacterized RDD family membrane protein YckC
VNGQGTSALPLAADALQGRPAGLVTRTLAAAIDVLLVAVVMIVAYMGVAAAVFAWNPRTFRFPAPSGLLTIAVAGGIAVTYLAISWWIGGRTYGSAVLGLRVVTAAGGDLRLLQALARGAACTFFPLGLAWCAVDPGRRGVHDYLVRSRVIYDWRPHQS